jgi:hypothetical protein
MQRVLEGHAQLPGAYLTCSGKLVAVRWRLGKADCTLEISLWLPMGLDLPGGSVSLVSALAVKIDRGCWIPTYCGSRTKGLPDGEDMVGHGRNQD